MNWLRRYCNEAGCENLSVVTATEEEVSEGKAGPRRCRDQLYSVSGPSFLLSI